MKSVLTILFSFGLIFLQAQNFIDKNFAQYEDFNETTVVHVAAKSFEYASYIIPSNDEEEIALKEFVASVNSLDLIAVSDLESAKSEYRRGVRILEAGYKELINIKDKASHYSFYIDSNDDIVYELVGIGNDENDFFVVSVTGEMKLDLIASIISKIDSDDFSPLAKLGEYDAAQFELYPNPVNSSSKLTIEIPDGMIGGSGTVYDLSGSALDKFDITDVQHTLKINNLSPGTYVIGLSKDEISLKKQVVIVR